MATIIHPSAVVSPLAILGQDVYIGPFCVIEAGVVIGDRCCLTAHVSVKQGTTLGTDNEITDGAVLGGKPQHARVGDRYGGLSIGNFNRIRENATLHSAMQPGQCTAIGDQNLIMVNAHIAHDCRIGNQTIIVNNAMLAGHVVIEDFAYISGGVGVHQFCRVGQHAMVGGQAHIVQDVPPFVTVDGATSRVVGLNRVGLQRRGFRDTDLAQLKQAYRVIYRSGLKWAEVLEVLSRDFATGPASTFLSFLSTGKRGFVQERRVPRGATVKMPDLDERGFIEPSLRKVG